jgi:hypothetical protein
MSSYKQILDKIGVHTYSDISHHRGSDPNFPGRIVLNAREGLHTIDLSSEWSDLCYATWILVGKDTQKYEAAWDSIATALATKPRGFEPCSGGEFIEALAAEFVLQNQYIFSGKGKDD